MKILLRTSQGRLDWIEAREVVLEPARVRGLVEDWEDDAEVRPVLRTLLGEGPAAGADDERLLADVARLLQAGSVRLLDERAQALPSMPAEAAVAEEAQAEPAPARATATAVDEAPPPPTQCTNPACKDAFADAAEHGHPLVSREAAGC